jgi:hypothetical protein
MVKEKAAESPVPGGDYLELYKMLHEERVSLGEEARKLEMGRYHSGCSPLRLAGDAQGPWGTMVYRSAPRYTRRLPSRCPGRENPLYQRILNTH